MLRVRERLNQSLVHSIVATADRDRILQHAQNLMQCCGDAGLIQRVTEAAARDDIDMDTVLGFILSAWRSGIDNFTAR